MTDPGTRIISPKDVKMTPGWPAIAIALSIVSSGVTQTGHPGPWTRVISGGSRSPESDLTIVCVCPPQISMIVQGRVTIARICRATAAAAA